MSSVVRKAHEIEILWSTVRAGLCPRSIVGFKSGRIGLKLAPEGVGANANTV